MEANTFDVDLPRDEPLAMPPPSLTTARLRLRPLAEGDRDRLVALDADPDVRRYVDQPNPSTRTDVERVLPRFLARFGPTNEPSFRAAEVAETSAFIGWFHLRPVDDQPDWLDVGYRIRREHWGRGYATEGATALVRRAFAELGAARVVAHTLEANAASRRVLEKAGLRISGRYLHRGALPALAYALSREELQSADAMHDLEPPVEPPLG